MTKDILVASNSSANLNKAASLGQPILNPQKFLKKISLKIWIDSSFPSSILILFQMNLAH